MNKGTWIVIVVVAAAIGYLVGRNNQRVISGVEVEYIEAMMLEPIEVRPTINKNGEREVVIAELPIVAAPAVDVELTERDTTALTTAMVEIPISTSIYKGDGWSAEISGFGVDLRSITTTKTTITVTQPPTWEVLAMGGADLYNTWAGGSVIRRFGALYTELDIGWSFTVESPYIGARVGITLFKR